MTGVGFRYSTFIKSSEFTSLKGYVRNISHGEVEVFVQGDEKEVARMLAWLKDGPRFSRVDQFESVKTSLDQELSEFEII
ncbi:MAG: acylphosphatase [Lentisphaerae bacterium]|nr:acylphosphatase [Lentisphaerota bacterium]